MTWTDQRPLAFAEEAATLRAPPHKAGWRLEFELWSQPRPVAGSMWSTLEWWWERSALGAMVVDAQGVGANTGRVSWGALWQVQMEVWLLSDTYLELFVALKARGQGVAAGASAAFKVVLPHAWVSAAVPVKQNAGVGYLDLEAFRALWPLLRFYAQAQEIRVDRMLSPGSLNDDLPAWDVEGPIEAAIPGADAGWWVRRTVDGWLDAYDPRTVRALYADEILWAMGQEGFDVLFTRLAPWPELTSLSLYKCTLLENVDGLGNLNAIETLDLSGCHSLRDVDGLSKLTALKELDLRGCEKLERGDVLGRLPGIEKLHLGGCVSLKAVGAPAMPSKLTLLDLRECASLEGLEVLGGHNGLQHLYLSRCVWLENVEGLSSLKDLKTLDLSFCASLKSVDGLASLTELTKLDLSFCESLENLDGLEALTKLTTLTLNGCRSLEHVDGLASLTRLRSLELSGCHSLRDLGGLASLNALRGLSLNDCNLLPRAHRRHWSGDELQGFLRSLVQP